MLNPSQLNDAARLLWIAESFGSDILYDAECFDRVFRWSRFAKLDREVLKVVRGIIEAERNRLGEPRVGPGYTAENENNDGTER
jgi:hypothetical protein